MIIPFNSETRDNYPKDFVEMVEKGECSAPCDFKVVDGVMVPFEEEDYLKDLETEEGKQSASEYASRYIPKLKGYLKETDWVTAKIVEDETARDKYEDIITNRKETRAKINELEKYIIEVQ